MQQFQQDASVLVFLLTTGVGGVGLTLTAADRVIIVDPAWNPQVDNQSVDRCAYHTKKAENGAVVVGDRLCE